MGYFDYDDYYVEPSEFDEKCRELIDMLRSSATDEIKSELETLRKENASMKDIAENYKEKVRELEKAKNQYEWNEAKLRREIESEVRRARLSQILEGFQTVLYRVDNQGIEKPKCDKCDENGYIHFPSPSGRDCTEYCDCRDKLPYYVPVEYTCVSFKLFEHGVRDGKLGGWYRCKESDNSYYAPSEFAADKMYVGQDFAELAYYRVFFEDRETAQRYADWLNERSAQE